MNKDRNLAINIMLGDCLGWDSETNALKEAFARGEDYMKRKVKKCRNLILEEVMSDGRIPLEVVDRVCAIIDKRFSDEE